MRTTMFALLLCSGALSLSAGDPPVFSLTSWVCDPLNCSQEKAVSASYSGSVTTNIWGSCASGAAPFAQGSVAAFGCAVDTDLTSAAGRGGGPEYYDDIYGFVSPDGVQGSGSIYGDVFGFQVDLYDMSSSADCYDDATVWDTPPPASC
jgi:hypothetical protein